MALSLSLRTDEAVWIQRNPDRCRKCGHLYIFHNYPNWDFCIVGECSCGSENEWARMKIIEGEYEVLG